MKSGIAFFLNLLTIINAIATEYEVVEAFGEVWNARKFDKPIDIRQATGFGNYLFIVEKSGKVKKLNLREKKLEGIFLDVSDNITTWTEEGLLGLAFHPKFKENLRLFTFRTVRTKAGRNNRLSEFRAKNVSNLVVDKKSEIILIDQIDDAVNHNGGDLHFGPDGYLYVSLGDEGGGGDNFQNSQLIDKDFFAGIIRIDVDKKSGNLEPNPHPAVKRNANPNNPNNSKANYLVPSDNPWVGAKEFLSQRINPKRVRSEFWAVGLRNVWRMSFDPETGNLWAGDVGQNAREEVNIITKGGNYGWSLREGKIAFPRSHWKKILTNYSKLNFNEPVWDYPHNEGVCVTGGIVHRGSALPYLRGHYIFADYVSGKIWALRSSNNGKVEVRQIATSSGISAFAPDPRDGGILMANFDKNRIEKIVEK